MVYSYVTWFFLVRGSKCSLSLVFLFLSEHVLLAIKWSDIRDGIINAINKNISISILMMQIDETDSEVNNLLTNRTVSQVNQSLLLHLLTHYFVNIKRNLDSHYVYANLSSIERIISLLGHECN